MIDISPIQKQESNSVGINFLPLAKFSELGSVKQPIYYLKVFVGQEFRHSLTGSLVYVSQGCSQCVGQGCVLIRGPTREKSAPKFLQIVGRIIFLFFLFKYNCIYGNVEEENVFFYP